MTETWEDDWGESISSVDDKKPKVIATSKRRSSRRRSRSTSRSKGDFKELPRDEFTPPSLPVRDTSPPPTEDSMPAPSLPVKNESDVISMPAPSLSVKNESDVMDLDPSLEPPVETVKDDTLLPDVVLTEPLPEEFIGKNQYCIAPHEGHHDPDNGINILPTPVGKNHCCSFASLLVIQSIFSDYRNKIPYSLKGDKLQKAVDVGTDMYAYFLSLKKGVYPTYMEARQIIDNTTKNLFSGLTHKEGGCHQLNRTECRDHVEDILLQDCCREEDVYYHVTVENRSYSMFYSGYGSSTYQGYTLVETHGKMTSDNKGIYVLRDESEQAIIDYILQPFAAGDKVSVEIHTFF